MKWSIPIQTTMAIRALPDETRVDVMRRNEHDRRVRQLRNWVYLEAKRLGIPSLDSPRITLHIVPERPGKLPDFTPMTHAIVDGLLNADTIDHWTDFAASDHVHVLSDKPCADERLHRFHVIVEGHEAV